MKLLKLRRRAGIDVPEANEIAIAAPRTGEGADLVLEDPDTEIGLGWVGFHHRKGTEASCGFWLAADVRGRGLLTQALARGLPVGAGPASGRTRSSPNPLGSTGGQSGLPRRRRACRLHYPLRHRARP